jgi:hypothetical protein
MKNTALAICVLCASFGGASAEGLEAFYSMKEAASIENGIRPLNGGDGVTFITTLDGSQGLANKPNENPPSMFMYFDVSDEISLAIKGSLYIEVEYYDAEPGQMLQLQYDSLMEDALQMKYCPSEEQWGGWETGCRQWRKAVFFLKKPKFANEQNLGADFRLGGGPICVRYLRLTSEKPDNCERYDRLPESELRKRVKIGRGGELIVGGFDVPTREYVRQETRALDAAAPTLKSIGVTSHEGYVRWNLCEPAPGQYDWSVYDKYVELYKKHHLKWVPFLIVGSPYSLPDWYYKQPEAQGYVCLEHGQESDVQSLWNPALREHVARFIKAFCEHYRDEGVIESILLGITGNYGEAIYVASGNDWTSDIHGQYHTHPGFWAGDKYAIADFRAEMQKKYGTSNALSKAWGTKIADFSDVNPFPRDKAPNDRAWLDFCHWYIDSMSDWARFWMGETRKNYKGEIYLCTGGHAPPEHGSDFGDQCKLAADINGGVRITNEGSDYRANFSLTRWVASAGRQYGAYFSFEPAGGVSPEAVSGRVYNASTSGARGLHYYFPNLFGAKAATENFVTSGGEFRKRKPVEEIAVYYPETYIILKSNNFLGLLQPLRDRFDFDYMSDNQIRDGGLSKVKALVLLDGAISEADVWAKIVEWTRAGGLVLYSDGIGHLRTVEGDEHFHEALFSRNADLGKGRINVFHGPNEGEEYRAFLAEKLRQAPELGKKTRSALALDGVEDNVFYTLCGRKELVWLNATNQNVKKGDASIPPHSIISVKTK